MKQNKEGIWFVYDGDCPVCTMAAEVLCIKAEFGSLHLLDARENPKHPLMSEINKRRFDLDEGMVIKQGSRFFHGAAALQFMAVHGAPKGFFNQMNRLLFRSKFLAKTLYPAMRACRNMLVNLRGAGKIRNLAGNTAPIFKPIFGKSWNQLPPVMHMHYQNRPFTNERTRVQGTMSVQAIWFMRLLGPIAPLLGLVPVRNARNIPVTVDFVSEPNGEGLYFDRAFHYTDGHPVRFCSKMVPVGGNQIVEQLRCRLGWRVAFSWQDNRVHLNHQGYSLCLFGKFIPLPITWLVGTVHAEEWETGTNSFSMYVEITHPIFGKTYEYHGDFQGAAE